MITDTIGRRQLALLVFFIPIVFKISMLPSLLADAAGNDALFAAGFLIVFEALHLAVIVATLNFGGVKAVRDRWGNIPALLITLPLTAVFILKAAVFGMEIVNYVTLFLFYNTVNYAVSAVLIPVFFYVAIGGPRTFGRLCELSLLFLPFIAFFGALFGKLDLHFEYVLPFFSKGAAPVFSAIDGHLFWAFDFSPLIFFNLSQSSEQKKKKLPVILMGITVAILTVIGFFVLFIANYGNAASIVDNAFARLAAFNVVSTQIGSIEWPSVVMWLMSAVLCVAIKCYAGGKTLEYARIPPKVGIGIVTAAVGCTMLFLPDGINDSIELAESALRYVTLGIEIGITLLVFGILLAFRIIDVKKGRTAAEKAESGNGKTGKTDKNAVPAAEGADA